MENDGLILNNQIEGLVDGERVTRQAGSEEDTRKAIIDILQRCFDAQDWKDLNVKIGILFKCPGLSKQVLQAVVQHAMEYIDRTPDLDTRIELITTLTSVTVGEKYLHIERARLIKKLAKIKEDQGQIDEAANLMQEIMVEKISGMDKIEKTTFILELVRLSLDCQDYERAQILSRKIDLRVFKSGNKGKKKKSGNGNQCVVLSKLKKFYYELMIRYYSHANDYLEVFRCYKSIYEIPSVKEDPGQWMLVLMNMCWYLVLAPYDSVQSGFIDSTLRDENLLALPKCRLLLKRFATMAIIEHDGFMCSHAFGLEFLLEIFFLGHSFTEKANQDFRKRVTEHNILVVSTYTRRIDFVSLALLVQDSIEGVKSALREMIESKSLTAKIHESSKMVSFPTADDSRKALDARARMLKEYRDFELRCLAEYVYQFPAFEAAVLRSRQNQC